MEITIHKNELMALLPHSLDYSQIENMGNQSIENFNMNIVKFIISSIILKSVTFLGNKDVIKYNAHSEIPKKYWTSTIGNVYSAYINFLMNEKIIYRTYYREGKCFAYGLIVPYQYSRIFVEIIQIKDIHKRKSTFCNTSYTAKYEKSLIKFFDNTHFSVDPEKTEQDLFERYLNHSFPLEKSHGVPIEEHLKRYSNYIMALKKMVKFMNGEFRFTRNSTCFIEKRTTKKTYKTTGRFYNSFAYLNKEIRKNLIHKHGKLIEIDIKNCVPYLLSNYFIAKRPKITKKRINRINEYSSVYMCGETLKTSMDKEIERFNFSCINGEIYELFIDPLKDFYSERWSQVYLDNYSEEYNGSFKHDRDLAKKLFISMLFGKNSQYLGVQNIFRDKFPILYDILTTIKKQGYKRLSHELFGMEGWIMIDLVAKSLIKEYRRQIPIFTVHDCIATTKEYVDIVKCKIESVFYNLFRNSPKIDIG